MDQSDSDLLVPTLPFVVVARLSSVCTYRSLLMPPLYSALACHEKLFKLTSKSLISSLCHSHLPGVFLLS